jgi:small subunit ribosomal protein S20
LWWYQQNRKFAGQINDPHVKYIAVKKKGKKFWRKTLANIKSQIKRNRQNENRRLRNRNVRGSARSAVNQARAAFEENAPETKEAVLKAISALDKAAEKGVIHRNNAARRKGRLMKRLASFDPTAAFVEAPKAKKKTSK